MAQHFAAQQPKHFSDDWGGAGSDTALSRLAAVFKAWSPHEDGNSHEVLDDVGGFDKGGNGGGKGNGAGGGRGKPVKNNDPIAEDDAGAGYSTSSQSAVVTGSVLDNDIDPDGDALQLTGIDVADTRGAVSWNGDGTFTYTPGDSFLSLAEGEKAYDSFRYTVEDGRGGVSTATVTMEILGAAPIVTTPPPPPPTPEEEFDAPYYIDGLLAGPGLRHNADQPLNTETEVTFAFADAPPDYYEADSFVRDGFAAFDAEQQAVTRSALEDFASVSGLTFTETPLEEADIVIGFADIGAAGFAYYPSADATGNTTGDIWLDLTLSDDPLMQGTDSYRTLIHEIGHSLGLDHPNLPSDENSQHYTMMSAFGADRSGGAPETPQLYDIEALRYLYGDGANATGDDVYTFEDVDSRLMTLVDDGGTDTLDMSAATYGVEIDLEPGSASSVLPVGADNLTLANATVIENLIGSDFDDVLSGNSADNILTGGEGADIFQSGSGGSDTVSDFADGIDLIKFLNKNWADINLTDTEDGLLINYGEGTLLLSGTESSEIDETDFLFG